MLWDAILAQGICAGYRPVGGDQNRWAEVEVRTGAHLDLRVVAALDTGTGRESEPTALAVGPVRGLAPAALMHNELGSLGVTDD